jgi:hypothetical protein
MRTSHLFLLPIVIAACGGEPPPAALNPSPPSTATTPPPPAPTPTGLGAYVETKPRWENPGGMWMPHQIAAPAHAAKLKELGLAFDPKDLSDPTSGVLGAVVSLGGCSASFVSPDGLVITNHHCATGALQHNATPEANLLKQGYLAKTRGDEKNNGPTARVFVTQKVSEVTEKVRAGLDKIKDDRERFKAIEKRQKEIVAACEKDRPGIRCSAASFYEGAQHFLVEQLEIRDVRLVWAPPSGVGNYGGETDNWRWPRHTGDVSLFRAYVGKDGKPADYAADNVPYKPPHHLRLAKDPLRENDLVFVAGYPGRTYSLKTKAEVDQAVGWWYPRRQKMFEDYLARLESATKEDKEAQIRATSYVRRFANALTNTKGQIEGLTKGGLAAQKESAEKELRSAAPAVASALDDIAKVIADDAKWNETDAALDEVTLPRLVSVASTIVRMAEERAKPDAERDPDYQQRNWPRIEQSIKGVSTSYHRKVDEAVLGLALERTKKLAPTLDFGIKPDDVKKLYDDTKLADEKTRLELLTKAKTAELRASKDPIIQLAVRLRPMQKAAEERRERVSGKFAVVKPKYIEALKAFKKTEIAPDANSTLRVTYGTVRGYRPAPDAPPHRPFTVLSEVVKKHKAQEPFDVPSRLLDAYNAKKLGPYVDDKLGSEVPVDFLSDLHITGGNSGSATMNAKGELVGLAFDGNYEAMASDWVFVPSITRTIHVDARYIQWLLDAVEGGDHILKEMGVEPRVE